MDLTIDEEEISPERVQPNLQDNVPIELRLSSSAYAQVEGRVASITAAIAYGLRPCPTTATASSCGTLLQPNGSFQSMVVICPKCDLQVCFGCGESAPSWSMDMHPQHVQHIANCRIVSEWLGDVDEMDIAKAQERALLIVQAESEWMLQALTRLLQCPSLHKDMWDLVGTYMSAPGDWFPVLR